MPEFIKTVSFNRYALRLVQRIAGWDHHCLSRHDSMPAYKYRSGELFSIEWRDLGPERAILTLRGESPRTVRTANSTAVRVLRRRRAQTTGEGLVFRSPRSGKRFDNVVAAWDNLMSKAQISGFRWHDMRYHFASKLVMASVDLSTVRELLGHGDIITMTLRHTHLAPKVKAEAVERIVN